MEYLQNYLSVLPQYDRAEVEKLIQANQDLFDVKAISKVEFEALLQQLARRKDKITMLKSTGEQMDAEHFNDFHSSVNLDLEQLYKSHLTTEKVIANYDRILQGMLEDIQREITTLSTRIEELDLKAKGEDGLIIKTYGFEEGGKVANMETERDKFAHLFLDRDGTPLPTADLNRSFHKHYLSLPVKTLYNVMQDENGNVTATASVVYQAPSTYDDSNHPIKHAIDDSLQTYWSQVVMTNTPAYTSIKKKGDKNEWRPTS